MCSESSDATIAVIPRERYSLTRQVVEAIYEHTDQPFDLIVVDGGSPPSVASYLERASAERGFQLIRRDYVLSPNEARNLAIARATTKYITFIDNDALASPGWLSKLVECAEETGAWVVGPVYLAGPPGTDLVHMAGGDAHIEDGGFVERHHHMNGRLHEVRPRLARGPTEMVEFHCMLVRRDVFDRFGPLDEGLLSLNEHCDLCLLVRQAGGDVYLEPDSVVTYVPPPPFGEGDRAFFVLRWSRDWNERSIERFCAKWKVKPLSGKLQKWLAWHRRSGYGWLRGVKPLDGLCERVLTRGVAQRREEGLRGA